MAKINKLYPTVVSTLILKGELPIFDLSDSVIPVVVLEDFSKVAAVGAVGSVTIYTAGRQAAPAAGFILATSGALPAGTYDVLWYVTSSQSLDETQFEWRDAADATNRLAVVNLGKTTGGEFHSPQPWRFATNENERFRILNQTALAAVVQGVLVVTRIA